MDGIEQMNHQRMLTSASHQRILSLEGHQKVIQWKTKCLWLVTNDMSRLQEWVEWFQLDKVFECPVDSAQLEGALVNYVTYFGRGIQTRTMWEILLDDHHNPLVTYKDNYPLADVLRSQSSVSLLLTMEYQAVDHYQTLGQLRQVQFQVRPCSSSSSSPSSLSLDRGMITCPICMLVKPGVRHTSCQHWFCAQCLYITFFMYQKCAMCRQPYMEGTFEGDTDSIQHQIPVQVVRYVHTKMDKLMRIINDLEGRIVVVVDPSELHELIVFMSFQLESKSSVVVNDGAGEVMLVTPTMLKPLRYELKPQYVICMILTEDMLSTLEFYFDDCQVMFVAPLQSMTHVLLKQHNQRGLFDHNHHRKLDDSQLLSRYKALF
jgi:hypothetical protein